MKKLIIVLAAFVAGVAVSSVWFCKDKLFALQKSEDMVVSENNKETSFELTEYRKKLDICEETASKKLENVVTNADMINFSYEENNCYKDVGNQLIDKYYSKHAKEMKKNLEDFIKASYDVNSDIFLMRDFCEPGCGSMFLPVYISETGGDIKTLILRYIGITEIDLDN